jgi:hypothetical protein
MHDKFLEAIMIALAVYAVLMIWFRGTIFDRAHAYFEAIGGWLKELTGCPICLGVHLTFWITLFFLLPSVIVKGGWDLLFLPLQFLAALGVVYVLNSEWPVKPDQYRTVKIYSEPKYVSVTTVTPTSPITGPSNSVT